LLLHSNNEITSYTLEVLENYKYFFCNVYKHKRIGYCGAMPEGKMDYFISALKQYADFTSRTVRKDFWLFYLNYMVFNFLIYTLCEVLGSFLIFAVFFIGMFIPLISITTRRLHDTGRSGWWQLLTLIPVVGGFILLIFLIQDSCDDNKYGAKSKLRWMNLP
jgi:uncharacterized membrane protein YhaH (DUF805 family)